MAPLCIWFAGDWLDNGIFRCVYHKNEREIPAAVKGKVHLSKIPPWYLSLATYSFSQRTRFPTCVLKKKNGNRNQEVDKMMLGV